MLDRRGACPRHDGSPAALVGDVYTWDALAGTVGMRVMFGSYEVIARGCSGPRVGARSFTPAGVLRQPAARLRPNVSLQLTWVRGAPTAQRARTLRPRS